MPSNTSAPAFYPAEILPISVLPVAYRVPTTNAVLTLRTLMGQNVNLPGWSPLAGWLALAASLLVALVATSRTARWRQP